MRDAKDIAFTLHKINFAEGGDDSLEFYDHIGMPDGRTAKEWIESWPELRKEMKL